VRNDHEPGTLIFLFAMPIDRQSRATPTGQRPPATAAGAVLQFVSELWNAMLLDRSLFARAAAVPALWRKSGLIVILAALSSDSLGLYSDLDVFLVRAIASWSLIPIMILALLRWSAGTAGGFVVCRIFREDVAYSRLMRCAGFGYAPALIHLVPALLYWLDLLPVTLAMVTVVRWIALPWVIAALSVGAAAAGVSTRGRAVAVAIVLFVSANLFDVLLDVALLTALGLPHSLPLPADGVL
jgi:hypothetical protein